MASAAPEEILDPDLPICDPHHHLWDYPVSQYLLPDFLADLDCGHRIESTVFVECGAFYRAGGPEHLSMVGETEFAAGVAAMAASGRYGQARVCAGIIGRADLTLGVEVAPVLEAHIRAGGGRFRGIRHAAAWDGSPQIRSNHANAPPGVYYDPRFREGCAQLANFGLTLESWLYHTQVGDLVDLARACPSLPIMCNHVGGPLGIGPYAARRSEVFGDWLAGVRELATCPNVHIKLGGLGMPMCGFGFHERPSSATSADQAEAWRPYLETCIELFGVERCMFESNFPVDKASCSYANLWNAFKRLAQGASALQKAALFRDNATAFYRLDPH
jgi:predicted TIM-barrel fold metal-dependent hydrolase